MLPIQIDNIILPDGVQVFQDQQSVGSRVNEYSINDGGYNLTRRGRRTTKKLQISGTFTRSSDCNSCQYTPCQFQDLLSRLRSFGTVKLYATDPVCDEFYSINVVCADPYFIAVEKNNFEFTLNLTSTDSQWKQIPKNKICQKQNTALCGYKNWIFNNKIDTDRPTYCSPIFEQFDPFWSPYQLSNPTIDIKNIAGNVVITSGGISSQCGAGSWTSTSGGSMAITPPSAIDISTYNDGTKASLLDNVVFELSVNTVSALNTLALRFLTGIVGDWSMFVDIQNQIILTDNTCTTVRIPISYSLKNQAGMNLSSISGMNLFNIGTAQATINNLRIEKAFGVNYTQFGVFGDLTRSVGVEANPNSDIQFYVVFNANTNIKTIQYGNDTFDLPTNTIATAIYDNKVEILLPTGVQTIRRIKTVYENGEAIGLTVASLDTVQSYYQIIKTTI